MSFCLHTNGVYCDNCRPGRWERPPKGVGIPVPEPTNWSGARMLMPTPVLCPVCKGTRVVAWDFYPDDPPLLPGEERADGDEHRSCLTCKGQGTVR